MQKVNLRSYDPATRLITEECLRAFERDDAVQPTALALRLMDAPQMMMHCPQHHYLVPAALLTGAHKAAGSPVGALRDALMEAMMRAKNALPAFCGLYGSCGAAVGLGIYASIWTDADQYAGHTWALANRIVGECLLKISRVDGPRCCKRSSYMALEVGEAFSGREFGLRMGQAEPIRCRHSQRNQQECKKDGCPYYPGGDAQQERRPAP